MIEREENRRYTDPQQLKKDLELIYKDVATNDNVNDITNRIDCWIALESLSPQSYKNELDLCFGNEERLVKLDEALPWLYDPTEEELKQRQADKKRPIIYYEVILGAVKLNKAVNALSGVYGKDEEAAYCDPQSKVAIASILLTEDGYNVEENSVSISSFAWALNFALEKRLDVLSNWASVEERMKTEISNRLQQAEKKRVGLKIITEIYDLLVEHFNLQQDMIVKPTFAVRILRSKSSQEKVSCSLLNSFFIQDLCMAKERYSTSDVMTGYLGKTSPTSVTDLLKNNDAIDEALSPKNMPYARWPVGEGRALSLLQQSAVNLIAKDLENGGLFSVNGPPGTGKTTLLRDLIAHVIEKKAEAMCAFAHPSEAFKETSVSVKCTEKIVYSVSSVDDSLKGYEILIASSNNAAVENISKELPAIDAISDHKYSYFHTISNKVADIAAKREPKEAYEEDEVDILNHEAQKTWGLISAVFGNSSNINAFNKVFWWSEDYSIRVYLKAIMGEDVSIKVYDENTGECKYKRQPYIIDNENYPVNPDVAQIEWVKAKTRFANLKKEIAADLEQLEEVRRLCIEIKKCSKSIDTWVEKIHATGKKLSAIMPANHWYNVLFGDLEYDFELRIDEFMSNKNVAPHWIYRLFRTKRWGLWRNLQELYKVYRAYKARFYVLKSRLEGVRDKCGVIIDEDFFKLSYKDQQISHPWLTESINNKRDELFYAAINVHKAFLGCVPKQVHNNLASFQECIKGGYTESDRASNLMNDLWATLCMVVPVISTTFASAGNMLKGSKIESLGWLLIDEAGQSVPQAAVGSIMRSKRVVVVGDPMQIQPIASIPSKLSDQICKHLNVDPCFWTAPTASVQVLADRVSPYQSAFATDLGRRPVGLPLLVHRRCADPMFSISNEIAYNNLMVSQVREKPDDIASIIGQSRWIDVQSENEELQTKWVLEEGNAVIAMFEELAAHGFIKPDIFIITPFRQVAYGMRSLIKQNKKLFAKLGINVTKYAYNNVGTVHTVQGREVDTIIMLLGASVKSQFGSRKWASSSPNLLNVAVSRAKKSMYVVGSKAAWADQGLFSILSKRL